MAVRSWFWLAAMKVNFNIDPGLVRGLSGKEEEQQGVKQKKRGPPMLQSAGHHGITRVHKAAMDAVRKDAELRYSLACANTIGSLLLKREADEVPKVNAFAEDLLKEYQHASKPVPCEVEREACEKCYGAGDVLKCASMVDAYGKCAQEAWRKAYAPGSSPVASQGAV